MRVGLFVSCLVDLMRPQIGVAAVQLLRQAGISPIFPPQQTCCGQIAFTSGYQKDARLLAQQCADLFLECDKVIFLSASCCGVFRAHWQEMFDDDNNKMRDFANKCVELSEFLQEIDFTPSPHPPLRATYHDCCAGLRELGIKTGPRALLQKAGIEIIEMNDCEECCGFGGAFATKFSDISTAMAERKCRNIEESGADVVLLGDLGCILHLGGKLSRQNSSVRIAHWAEILAAHDDKNTAPFIGR